MTNEQINKRFAELVGLCWHERIEKRSSTLPFPEIICSCGRPDHLGTYRDHINPDFISDPRLVLREMMKREDWLSFIYALSGDGAIPAARFIETYILDTTGLLVKAGIEWLEKEGRVRKQNTI